MTESLRRALAAAARLPAAKQEVLAARLLAELAAEDEFDRALSRTSDRLAQLAVDALSEHGAGQTQSLDPERL